MAFAGPLAAQIRMPADLHPEEDPGALAGQGGAGTAVGLSNERPATIRGRRGSRAFAIHHGILGGSASDSILGRPQCR